METRASHILVGGFVLAFLAGLVGFAVWIAKVDLDAEYKDYDIYFNDTVSGLVKRGTVFYLGIPVGEVRDITLAPDDPRKVRVWVRLRAEVPVNEGATARLDFQGFTGVAYIELFGGPPEAPLLTPHPGQERPVIPAQVSGLQVLFASAPDLLDAAGLAVAQVQKLLADENLAEIAGILKNTNQITGNLATGTKDIDGLIVDARAALVEVAGAANAIQKLANSGNELIANDAKPLIAEAIKTMQTAQEMLGRVDALVAANEGAVTQFVNGSLPEVSRMIVDLRKTARTLSRLVTRIEQNPGEIIFGTPEDEYDPKTRTQGDKK
ncbi:MlaD family protein [Kordiimonas sp. SCSIO 12610]|uniref:MlaD family protein n=1 Tax=Kordiimonas sp. SCSIO 12610 TaxID=2829597 RepID=UPI00210B68A1|nr:MlaD family protein [Kordiimonas sp. SCSIO 12610]UTW55163.1 MCE family protein [Kordiimonas sp. SCSIO 12610]